MNQNGAKLNASRSLAVGHPSFRVVQLRFETQANDCLGTTPSYNWEVLK
jgi:hypothetical protein